MRKIIIVVTAASLLIVGCKSANKQQKGTVIGAAGGAAIGGVAGNWIGKKMDQQAKELKQAVPTAQVERVNEGINVTFESGLMFKINSSEISDSYKSDLGSAAEVFVKYPETNIVIEGHTDDTGSDD